MNKRQKEVQQAFLDNEKAVLKKLESNYQDALDEINSKIELLMARQDADMQHVIYQVEYQKALKTQVQAILETLQTNEFETVSEYLANSYHDGFIGTMYDLQGQGIPLVFPIDQEMVVAAVQHETKLSESLYTAMGKDIVDLRKKITGEISRGLSSGQMYGEISRNIASWANIPKNNAIRIARTEAHRIQCKATADAQVRAKEKGADVVKQWDASLDGKTRTTHRELDGQIRELEKPFVANGHKAMYPGAFGRPEEDINCRCALLQRARWALGNDYTKWSEDAPVVISDDGTTQFTIIEAKNYKQFQKKYKQASERVRQGAQKMNSKAAELTEAENITRSMAYAVESKMLDSREYVNKFNSMAENAELRREYHRAAKEMLKHRSGQNGEDLYIYNSKTGRWYKSTTGKEAGKPEYTEEILDAIAKAKPGELISFHNHPAGMPPSASDINSALGNGYAKGYALCHDGKIYEYTASDRYIDMSIYNLHLAKYKKEGYNEFEAQLATMEYLSGIYGFSFKEVK